MPVEFLLHGLLHTFFCSSALDLGGHRGALVYVCMGAATDTVAPGTSKQSKMCCAAEGMELPEGVSRQAIAKFLEWDAECHATREGPKGSMGWAEGRGALHPSIAAHQQGIKGWQLGQKVHPKLAELAGNIEALWRQMFPLDFSQTDMDPRWKLVDSMDPNQVRTSSLAHVHAYL